MKKIAYILGISLILSSCAGDWLETEPESSTATGTIFETTENAALAINGICRLMSNQYLSSQGFNGEGTIKTWYGNYPGMTSRNQTLLGGPLLLMLFITKEVLLLIAIILGSTIIS